MRDGQDWRVNGEKQRCEKCTNRDLCNRRAFTLELIKVIATPRMIMALAFLAITIIQIITGGK